MTKQRQLIVVAVFAFGFGLAFVEEAQAGPDYCCVIPATIHSVKELVRGSLILIQFPLTARTSCTRATICSAKSRCRHSVNRFYSL